MTELAIWERKAQSKHDGGCGCHQCQMHFQRVQEEYHEEQWRVNVWSPDQEEEWIEAQVRHKLENNKKQDQDN